MAEHATSTARHEDEDDLPPPRPKLSLGKKALLVLFLLLLTLILVHWRWGARVGSALDAEIARYRAKGEPILPEDFKYPSLAPEDNAALALRLAAKAAALSQEEQEVFNEWGLDKDLTPEQLAALEKIVASRPEVLEHLRKAKTKPGVDWGIRLRSPMITLLLPDLNGQRQVSSFLALSADLAHRRGDHAQALQLLADQVFVGRSINHPQFLVGHLISEAIAVAQLTSFVARNAHELQLAETTPSTKSSSINRPASRAQVEQLIRTLLDERPSIDGLTRALQGERAFQLDAANAIGNGTLSLNQLGNPGRPTGGVPLKGPLIRPLMQRDALAMLRYTTRTMEATQEATWPAARAKADFPQMQRLRGNPTMLLTNAMLPALENIGERHYRLIGDRRLAATLLALRLYQLDHAGRLPDTLEALVPNYLPAVPLDPFSPDNKPLRYLLRPDNALVYSVGPNETDDGGSDTDKRRPKEPARNIWSADDAVYRLIPTPREKSDPAGD